MSEAVTLISTEKAKSMAYRDGLLKAMSDQYENVTSSLDKFMQANWHENDDYAKLAQDVVCAVDKVLADHSDESSLFLRNILKPLKNIREQAQSVLDSMSIADESLMQNFTMGSSYASVYVLLFQSQGHNMQKWAQLLQSLGHYALGRPVYESEEDVQRVIRLRFSDAKEAYAEVAVSKDIIASSLNASNRQDRHGNALLSLPVGAINSQHILRFIHGKNQYRYYQGELINVPISTERH